MPLPPDQIRAFMARLPRECYARSSSRNYGRPAKKRHLSRTAAREAAPSPGLNQYQCSVCGHWHNGHPPAA